MKPLLPNNKSNTDGTSNIHLLDDGKLVSNPSNVFNDFFVNPRIQDSALSLTEENFGDHPSIAAIKSKSYKLDFAFKERNCNQLRIKNECQEIYWPRRFLSKDC